MAVKTREEFKASLLAKLGDDTSDEALALLEDVDDTFSDFERRTGDSGEWERKYNENDAAWRKRYRERFMNGPAPDENKYTETKETTEEIEEKTTFESLFKEGK